MPRPLTSWELRGKRVFDVHGEPVGKVMDTHPTDGGWDTDLLLVHVGRHFPQRRWVPVEGARILGDGVYVNWSRMAIEDGPDATDHRWAHPAELANAYYVTAD